MKRIVFALLVLAVTACCLSSCSVFQPVGEEETTDEVTSMVPGEHYVIKTDLPSDTDSEGHFVIHSSENRFVYLNDEKENEYVVFKFDGGFVYEIDRVIKYDSANDASAAMAEHGNAWNNDDAYIATAVFDQYVLLQYSPMNCEYSALFSQSAEVVESKMISILKQ